MYQIAILILLFSQVQQSTILFIFLFFTTLKIISSVSKNECSQTTKLKLDKFSKLTVCETSDPRKSSYGDMGHIPIHPEVLEWCCLGKYLVQVPAVITFHFPNSVTHTQKKTTYYLWNYVKYMTSIRMINHLKTKNLSFYLFNLFNKSSIYTTYHIQDSAKCFKHIKIQASQQPGYRRLLLFSAFYK